MEFSKELVISLAEKVEVCKASSLYTVHYLYIVEYLQEIRLISLLLVVCVIHYLTKSC